MEFGGGGTLGSAGGSEVKRSGRQAVICVHSTQKNKFLPLLGKVWQGFNYAVFLPTPNFYVIKKWMSNSLKRTSRPNVLSSYRPKKCAFTLAEVLITLGIIGVVSVLVLSSVIPSIQDKQNIAKWKKEYSVINNAFNAVLAKDVTIYDQGGYTDEFVDAFQKELRIVDYCGISADDVPSDKICDNFNTYKNVKYKWSGVANIYSRYKALGVRTESNPGSYSPYGIQAYNFSRLALLLNDGAVIYLGESHGGPWIVVDVNNFNKGQMNSVVMYL